MIKIWSSLRVQIALPFLGLILASSVILSVLCYWFSLNMTVSNMTSQMEVQMKTANGNLNTFLGEYEHLISMLSIDEHITEYLINRDVSRYAFLRAELETILQQYLNANPHIVSVFMAQPSGDVIAYPLSSASSWEDPTMTDWYTAAMEKPGQPVWINPYINPSTRQTVLTIARTVQLQDMPAAVVGIEMTVDSLVQLMKEIQIGSNGYAFIVDNFGRLVSHPDHARIGQSQTEESYFSHMMELGEEGSFEYAVEGSKQLLSFTTNQKTGWKLAGTIPLAEFQQAATGIVRPIGLSVVAILIVAFLLSFPVARRITRPIFQLRNFMANVTQGDLSVRSGMKRKDEIGQLAEGFDLMVEQLERLIRQIRYTSTQLSESAQVLLTSAEDNTASANQVAITMQEIASGAGDQANLVEKNMEAIESLNQSIEGVSQETKSLEQLSAEMLRLSRDGEETLNRLKQSSVRSLAYSKDTSQAMTSLHEKMEQISDIANTVGEIAAQTNLLAMNAAIEAARAGEHGRGFGVVAEEVRKLANQSEAALNQIRELVALVLAEADHSRSLTEASREAILEQDESVQDTNRAFALINQSIERQSSSIRQVVEAINRITQDKDVIASSMAELQSISQSAAAGTEEASAAMQQQNASMEQLNKLAEDMEQISNDLRQELERFKVKG